MGLQLSHSKSEVICTIENTESRNLILEDRPDLCITDISKATILGSPVGTNEQIDETIQEKTRLLKLMGERWEKLQMQDALLLLRHSFAIPDPDLILILFILRTAPCFLSAQLEVYDDLLRSVLSRIPNVSLEKESEWFQAILPVAMGGLGIRRAVQLAPSAFLASAAGCSDLIHQLLPPSCP